MISPKLRTLGLRKEIFQLVKDHNTMQEVVSNGELSEWRDKWTKGIKAMKARELKIVENVRKEIVNCTDEAVKIYTDLIQSAADKRLSKLHSICPPVTSIPCPQTLNREMLDVLNVFQSNNYKETTTLTEAAEGFLTRYKLKSKVLSLEDSLRQKTDITNPDSTLPSPYPKLLESLIECYDPDYFNGEKSQYHFLTEQFLEFFGRNIPQKLYKSEYDKEVQDFRKGKYHKGVWTVKSL